VVWVETSEEHDVGTSPVTDFEHYFSTAKPSLLRQAYVYTGDVEEAKDLVQETLARAWRDWRRVGQLEDPQAWARKVLHNLAVGSWRRRRARHRYDQRSGASRTEPVAGPSTDRLDLARALKDLREKERRVLVLRAVVGLSIPEIAAELGASEGSVRVWLSRARAAVATAMGGERSGTVR
jgi:RNA polymerase sigma-70 factor, ECF subfamily